MFSSSTYRHWFILLCSPLFCLFAATSVLAGHPDLTSLSLDELLNLEVTSAARRPQGLYDTAAAIYVISREDIRRSGATSIPEVLRMVPGIQVARINSSVWAVSARGLTSRYANKLLVLQDGRTLYNTLFSGVYWDTQDTVLEDIDRIEVIRGPGAALWGANAVNGVINIITRSAAETQGTLLSLTAGNEDRLIATARQGLALGDRSHLRVYAKGFERDSGSEPGGSENSDDWRSLRGGFRFDYDQTGSQHLTLQGELYTGTVGETFQQATLTPPFSTIVAADTDTDGGHLLGRWKKTFSAASDISLQLFYDRARNSDIISGQDQQTLDLDFQHRLSPRSGHNLVWGIGIRHYWDDTKQGAIIRFNPGEESYDLFTAFVNDQLSLVPDRLELILGTQVEHNDYSGFEYQPTLRLLWTPRSFYSIWAAVSRSVRTPSRAERGLDLRQNIVPLAALSPLPPGVSSPPDLAQFSLTGSDGFDAETAWTYELGMRCQPASSTYLEIVLYHSRYKGLLTAQLGTPVNEGSNWLLPLEASNHLDLDSYGLEVAADWLLRPNWKLQAAYTYLNILPHLEDTARPTILPTSVNNDPHHQLSLRSSLDFLNHWEWDLGLRLVDDLPDSDVSGYLAVDTRLAWRPTREWQLELIGQNLTDPQHPEFVSDALSSAEIEVDRSLLARATWRF